MIVDSAEVSIGAGATVNVFSGKASEFPGGPVVETLYMVADAAGITCQLTVNQAGADGAIAQLSPISSGTPVNVAAAAGEGPKTDEDLMLPGNPVPAGARQALNVTNTTAGAILVRYRNMLQ